MAKGEILNPFPHTDAFWRLCSRWLWPKQNLCHNKQFILLLHCFKLFKNWTFHYKDVNIILPKIVFMILLTCVGSDKTEEMDRLIGTYTLHKCQIVLCTNSIMMCLFCQKWGIISCTCDSTEVSSLALTLIRQFCSRRLWTYFVKT